MPDNPSNAHEYSVSELAGNLKRTIEETFGHVRVRGELGRVTIAKSGHCYLDIKDDRAVINSIIWKGQMSRLSMRPEEGMEVICEGKLTTYPGRSNYQLVISKMELAGAGALMALFEKRKRAFSEEGLFSESRKKELPFLPQTIGVVTSPTGAVIRDILHRISDRFPSHVLVWPVLVQGDKAASQIASAITGFNHAEGFPRPDVLIVARGGGSLEDLWCFNEEAVVRAVAASNIPVIGAVGHETDWTLVDYVSDYRAPTPTGAAEVAVPVRADYLETVADYGLRMSRGLRRHVAERTTRLSAARLPRIENLMASPQQRLDLALARLPKPAQMFAPLSARLDRARLPRLDNLTNLLRGRLSQVILPKPEQLLQPKRQRLSLAGQRLRAEPIKLENVRRAERLSGFGQRAETAAVRDLERRAKRLEKAGQLLEAFSYQGVLKRGFAVVQNADGKLIRSKDGVSAGEGVTLTFGDGSRDAIIDSDVGSYITKKTPAKKPKKKPATKQADKSQPDLF